MIRADTENTQQKSVSDNKYVFKGIPYLGAEDVKSCAKFSNFIQSSLLIAKILDNNTECLNDSKAQARRFPG